jgi:ankyrin
MSYCVFTGDAALDLAVEFDEMHNAEYLLAHKANPNVFNSEGYSPLQQCKDTKMMDLLLKSKATVNACNSHMSTALHSAAARHQTALVEMLLHHDACPNQIDYGGHTPLHFAAMKGDHESVKMLLLARANPNMASYILQETPLHKAVLKNCFKSTKLLLDAQADVNANDQFCSTPLLQGVKHRRDLVIDILLKFRADIHAQDIDGLGVLTLAERNPSLTLLLSKFQWQQTVFEFCKGLHPRLGRDSAIRRCWTADLSERHLIWLIGLFLKPAE